MKKVFTVLILLPAFSICHAQLKTDTSGKTVFTKPVRTTQVKQTLQTPGSNTVVEKLPDLRITTATVNAVATSQGVYKLTIKCTVKNEGNAPISLANVSFHGLVAPENKLHLPVNATAYTSACGSTGGLAREILQPGASFSKEYYCFNVSAAPGEKPVYVLLLNRDSDVKELNKDNNRQNVYITFQ